MQDFPLVKAAGDVAWPHNDFLHNQYHTIISG
jgi:hypothetical protein